MAAQTAPPYTTTAVGTKRAQDCVLYDADGNQIVSLGGAGTQYTEGDTDTTITGTAILWEDAGDTLVTASASSPFPVEIVAGAGSGGTASADDADFTAGTTSGTPAMGVYESSPSNVTDGDLGIVGITQGRRLKTSATVDAALPAGDNNIGNVDVVTSALPTGASTLAEQQTQTTALQLLDDTVKTDDNAFTPATDKVLMIGALADDTSPDSVNEGDAGVLRMSLARALHTVSVADTATLSSVNSSASSASLLSANANRIGMLVSNDDANPLYLKYGTTASTTSYTVQIAGNGGYWEMPRPVYTGAIDGIWSADGSGAARITELT